MRNKTQRTNQMQKKKKKKKYAWAQWWIHISYCYFRWPTLANTIVWRTCNIESLSAYDITHIVGSTNWSERIFSWRCLKIDFMPCSVVACTAYTIYSRIKCIRSGGWLVRSQQFERGSVEVMKPSSGCKHVWKCFSSGTNVLQKQMQMPATYR